MSLESPSIEGLTPKAAPYKVTDSKGLYLLIQPTGVRYWRFRFRWAGKQNTLSCGVYPDVTLDEARIKRDTFRRLLSQGRNPSEHAKVERSAKLDEEARQLAATRFTLDSDGALSFRLGKRCMSLSPTETTELRVFLDATKGVHAKGEHRAAD